MAQALGELIHHVLLEKIQKLGPATLLFRHGSSRVIRFCFSGWIFAAPNYLAHRGQYVPGGIPGSGSETTSVLGLVYNLADYVNENASCFASPPYPGVPPLRQEGETRL